jgi:hypothetical protein
MKPTFFLFVLSVCILPVCNAQKKAGIMKHKSCKTSVNDFYSWVNKKRHKYFDKLEKNKKSDKIKSISYVEEDTLLTSSDINIYYRKISDKDNYYLLFNPKIKSLVLRQAKNMLENPKRKVGFSFLRKKLHAVLKIGNIVDVMELKFNNGKIINDYAICNNENNMLVYDNVFIDFMYIRINVFTTKSETEGKDTINIKCKTLEKWIKVYPPSNR